MFSDRTKGEYSAYGTAILWSLFPVVTVLTVQGLSPLFTASIATGFSALFFACMISFRRGWSQLLRREAWRDMLLATFFIGIIFYALVFTGYRFTSAGNGAVVGLMEIFFTFLIINILLKHEKFDPLDALGAFLMVIGALFVLLPSRSDPWNIGDLLILLSTMSPPLGNMFAKRARKIVSAETLMFVRSGVSAPFLLLLAFLFEPMPSASALQSSLPYLLLSGIVLLGFSKILWIEAIHRLPIAKTAALTEVGVLLTLLFAYIFLDQPATLKQIIGALPIMVGLFLLTKKAENIGEV